MLLRRSDCYWRRVSMTRHLLSIIIYYIISELVSLNRGLVHVRDLPTHQPHQWPHNTSSSPDGMRSAWCRYCMFSTIGWDSIQNSRQHTIHKCYVTYLLFSWYQCPSCTVSSCTWASHHSEESRCLYFVVFIATRQFNPFVPSVPKWRQ